MCLLPAGSLLLLLLLLLLRLRASRFELLPCSIASCQQMCQRTLWDHSVQLLREIHSARSEALAIPSASNSTTSSWSSLGLICPRVSSEITVEVILCKYSRQHQLTNNNAPTMLRAHPAV